MYTSSKMTIKYKLCKTYYWRSTHNTVDGMQKQYWVDINQIYKPVTGGRSLLSYLVAKSKLSSISLSDLPSSNL